MNEPTQGELNSKTWLAHQLAAIADNDLHLREVLSWLTDEQLRALLLMMQGALEARRSA